MLVDVATVNSVKVSVVDVVDVIGVRDGDVPAALTVGVVVAGMLGMC